MTVIKNRSTFFVQDLKFSEMSGVFQEIFNANKVILVFVHHFIQELNQIKCYC